MPPCRGAEKNVESEENPENPKKVVKNPENRVENPENRAENPGNQEPNADAK